MAKRKNEILWRVGEWVAKFEPRTAEVECRHPLSGARVRGRLSFQSGEELWRIEPSADGCAARLSLVSPEDERRGYLVFHGSGGILRIAVVERGLVEYSGRLSFLGTATLGPDSFACRTTPPLGGDVVQMASGPADSGLNDSIFDVQKDTALRFAAERTRVVTMPPRAGRAMFQVEMQARAEEPALSSIEISVTRNYYRDRYAPWYRPLEKRRCPTAPTGWMSWNTYFDRAREQENLAEARAGAKYLKPYGLEIWSIESWQENSEAQPVRNFSNLTLRASPRKFPHGMKWLARQIRKLGFRPGIWIVPFGTGDEEFYRAHKEWFLHDRDGVPMTNWCGRFLIDPTNEDAQRYIAKTCRIMSRDWGYEFFKIDGMSVLNANYSCMFYEKRSVRAAFGRPCENPYERFIRMLRRGIGRDRILLACAGSYTSPDVAVADAARIGLDVVSLNKPPTWQNYLHQVVSTLRSLFTNNIIWYTDPDTLLLGSFAPLSSARVAAAVVALPGQLTFSGDKLAELPPERMWLLQRCFPACDVRPLDLFPIHALRRIWVLKVARPFGRWDVMSLFNFDEKESREIGFEMSDVGLDPRAEYLVWDFWRWRFLGKFSGSLSRKVQPKSNLLLAVHEHLGRPQFLSTDRHITQGATSLLRLEWDPKERVLSGRVMLVGRDPTRLAFFVPKGFRLAKAEAEGAHMEKVKTGRDGSLTMTLRSGVSREAEWRLRF